MLRLLTSVVVVALLSGCEFAAPGEFASDESATAQALTLGTVSPLEGTPGSSDTLWEINGERVMFRGSWIVPLSLTVGEVVPAITAEIADTAKTCPLCADDTAVVMTLVSTSGGVSTALAQTTSNSSGTVQTLTLATSHVVTSSESLQLRYGTFAVFPDPANRMDMVGAIQVGAVDVETIVVSPSFAQPSPGTTMTYDVEPSLPGVGFSGGLGITVPLALPVGARVNAVRAFVRDNTAGPTRLFAYLLSHSMTGTFSPIVASSITSGSGSSQTLALGPVFDPIQKGNAYDLVVVYNRGNALSYLSGVEIDIVRQ